MKSLFSTTLPSLALLPLLIFTESVYSLTTSNNRGGGAGLFKLDRFSVSCPADESCIRQFDPQLLEGNEHANQADDIWVAVYRSNNNKPSVFVRDEFFNAMGEATSGNNNMNNDDENNPNGNRNQQAQDQVDTSKISTPMALEKPVAVARLGRSADFEDKWVLDSMRCGLKKEDQDESCDGGSEFVEALSVCVDSLLLHHLKENAVVFEGSIRTKATLYSNKILEERGFSPVEELSKDMATHLSRYDACLESYALRTASTNLNPGARDRALQMVSLLGKLDEELEREAKKNANSNGDDSEDDYDPWANISMQI